MHKKPYFLITIDTDGDNLWSKPQKVTIQNATYLPRFQALCEQYNFKPTYLTNYEMAQCIQSQEFGKHLIKRHAGEIGMRLHPWDMPPVFKLT